MGKHKNNYKSKNGRYYVLKGSNAVMIAYNWDQANECFQKYICSPCLLYTSDAADEL